VWFSGLRGAACSGDVDGAASVAQFYGAREMVALPTGAAVVFDAATQKFRYVARSGALSTLTWNALYGSGAVDSPGGTDAGAGDAHIFVGVQVSPEGAALAPPNPRPLASLSPALSPETGREGADSGVTRSLVHPFTRSRP
jgi:hypothetical protein